MRSALPTPDEVWQQQFNQRIKDRIQYDFSSSAKFYLGCSGGMDSMLLLHLFAQIIPDRLHVLSIDHQLQSASAAWSALVAEICRGYGVACTIIPVSVAKGNIEAAARSARYHAFQKYLNQDDVLLLAHHQQDQAETVMLRLLQGAGVGGLSAMCCIETRTNVLNQQIYKLWRPLLDVSKQKIATWIQHQKLPYVDDPMNDDEDYDRVWGRKILWPVLEQRFPKMQEGICRSAQLMQDADQILAEVLAQDEEFCCLSPNKISIEKLQQLSSARQRQLLSKWMQADNAYRPPLAMVERLQKEVIHVRQDASSILHYANYYFTRFGEVIYRHTQQEWQYFHQSLEVQTIQFNFDKTHTIALGQVALQYANVGLSDALLNQDLLLCPRVGGEKFIPYGKSGHRVLKKLLQDAKIPPWYRHQVQILMYHTTLLGVFTPNGFWLADTIYVQKNGWCPKLYM